MSVGVVAPGMETGMTQLRAGFIGLGLIGTGMAQCIDRTGLPLVVWARRAEQMEVFDPSKRRNNPAELGRDVDVVCLCVLDEAAVDAVVFGQDGLAEGLAPGSLVVVQSTVSPDYVLNLAEKLAPQGVRVLDAPVSIGRGASSEGELTVMIGGDPADLERARPVLASMGTLIWLGGVGAGQRAKLVNNAMLTAHLGIAASALDVGEALGLDRAALAEVVSASSGRSGAIAMIAAAGTGVVNFAGGSAHTLLKKDAFLLRDCGPQIAASVLVRDALEFVEVMDDQLARHSHE